MDDKDDRTPRFGVYRCIPNQTTLCFAGLLIFVSPMVSDLNGNERRMKMKDNDGCSTFLCDEEK